MKKLHDTTIAHIAKILQVALLTGTDIIDHLRMIDLKEGEDDFLVLDDEYSNNHNKSINEMLEKVKDQE
jgi:hypothetical protein